MPNPNELLMQLGAQQKELAAAVEQMTIERTREMERLRGIKIMRFGPLEAQATSGQPLSINADTGAGGVTIGPDQGWTWSIKNLIIEGLTTGATPDVINILRSSLRIIFQLNGNSFGVTFGKGDQILNGGELLGFSSVGNMGSNNKIIIHGHAWQVPGEEIGKLL